MLLPVPMIDCLCYRPQSEGDNVIGSVHPSVRLCVCLSELSCLNRLTFDRAQQRAITVKFGAKGGHYRSKGHVCLSVISRACADNCADAVDRLLISKCCLPASDGKIEKCLNSM